MPVGGVPIGQLNGGTVSIGSKIGANQGSLNLTEKFVRLLIFNALITVCNGVISQPGSSKLLSHVFFLSNSGAQLDTEQKQRNNVGISLEEVGEENGSESEQKHPRAGENGNSVMMIMTAEAAAASEVLVKIQQTHPQIWTEAIEPRKILPKTDTPKEEREVHNNGNFKELPHWDLGLSGRTLLPKDPEFHQKG